MQIFFPYAQPIKVGECLDNRRLNKQILECLQILSVNTGIDIGWKIPKYVRNHPNTLLWKNDSPFLILYGLILCDEYKKRKKNKKIHKCHSIFIDKFFEYAMKSDYLFRDNLKHVSPELCKKHQRLLYEKNPVHYSQFRDV